MDDIDRQLIGLLRNDARALGGLARQGARRRTRHGAEPHGAPDAPTAPSSATRCG